MPQLNNLVFHSSFDGPIGNITNGAFLSADTVNGFTLQAFNNNGTVELQHVNGIVDQAVYFGGSEGSIFDDYIYVPDNVVLRPGSELTISLWFYWLNNSASGNVYNMLLEKGQNDAADSYALYVVDNVSCFI